MNSDYCAMYARTPKELAEIFSLMEESDRQRMKPAQWWEGLSETRWLPRISDVAGAPVLAWAPFIHEDVAGCPMSGGTEHDVAVALGGGRRIWE